ncbi:MAG: rod shape-determining protein MreD [Chromatiales bacterium]|jgi:rod shape-determining protein MreD
MVQEPRRGTLAIVFTFAAALVLTVLPLPDWAQIYRPQWHTLVLIYWCFALPQRVGVASGWTLGLIVDVITGSLLGQHALSLSIVAFLSVKLHQRVRVFPLWQQSLTVLTLLALERLLSLWIIGATGRPAPSLMYWMPVLVGMLLWPWMFIVLRDIRRRFRVT